MLVKHRYNQEGAGSLQPIKLPIVCELEDELVNHAIDANCPTDKFKVSIGGVVEDEAVSIEGCQTTSSYTTSQLCKTVSRFLM
jgi:hypothetical protein